MDQENVNTVMEPERSIKYIPKLPLHSLLYPHQDLLTMFAIFL